MLAYKWLNDDRVRNALGVREVLQVVKVVSTRLKENTVLILILFYCIYQGTVETWKRCPKTFSTYTEDVTSSVVYQKNLTETGLRALIYRFYSLIKTCYLDFFFLSFFEIET